MDTLTSADVLLFEGFRLDRCGLFRQDESGAFVSVPIGSRALSDFSACWSNRPAISSRGTRSWRPPGRERWSRTATCTVQISALRRVLDQGRAQGSCIQTVPGRGYRFVAPVTRVEPTDHRHPTDIPTMALADRSPGIGKRAIPARRVKSARSRAHRCERGVGFGAASSLRSIGALVLVTAMAAETWHSLWFWGAPQRRACRSSCCPSPISANDPEQQYFADGITEDLTTDLSRIADMFVISRNTAFTYRNKPVDTKQIGRELGVRYVLEGSVRRSGNQVRVNAQLIDAETDAHLWAERFDRDTGDLFALQDEITSRIASRAQPRTDRRGGRPADRSSRRAGLHSPRTRRVCEGRRRATTMRRRSACSSTRWRSIRSPSRRRAGWRRARGPRARLR